MSKLSTKTYDISGKESQALDLPKSVYGQEWNSDLMHQVMTSYESNSRLGTANSKGRSDVRGGGRKPWRQKGTGNARHGSRRSPIWAGGGVTHGPTSEKNYKKKINRKVKSKALGIVLTAKLNEGKVIFIDKFEQKENKTKNAKEILVKLSGIKGFETLNTESNKNNVLVVTKKYDEAIVRAFRNIPHANIATARTLNPLEAAKARYIVVTDAKDTNEIIASRLDKKYKELFGSEQSLETSNK